MAQKITLLIDDVDYEMIQRLADEEEVPFATRLSGIIRLGLKVVADRPGGERDASGLTVPERTLETLYGAGTRNVHPGSDAELHRNDDGTWVARRKG